MKSSQTIISILTNWINANDVDIEKVKEFLMPEDDISNISLTLTSHPNLNANNEIYIEWFDIDVYLQKKYLCNIILYTKNMNITYYF